MQIQCDIKKRGWLFCYVFSASAILVVPVRGQDTPAPQRQIKQEIKAVVRISKQMIDEVVARKEIAERIPLNACIMNFHSQGVIDGRGKLAADLKTEKGDGTFIMNGQGTFQACARNVRGPLVAVTPASGPFTSRTLVRFDGRKFSRDDTSVWSQVHLQLDRVEGRRGTIVGRAVGRVMQPVGQMMLPRAEIESAPVGNQYLKKFVNDFADEIITTLNRTTPVEVSLNRLFPETKGWEFYLSSNPGFIQAAYGPPNSELPVLPDNPGRLEDMRLEMWVRSTTQGAETLDTLSKQPLARQLMQRYLEATLPELAALTEERTVTAVGSWLVICVGARSRANEVVRGRKVDAGCAPISSPTEGASSIAGTTAIESYESWSQFDLKLERVRDLGYEVESCLVDLGETAEATTATCLSQRDFDCIMFGAGLRAEPHLPRFEKLLNLVHAKAPGAKICFNTTPADTAEAIQRWV